MHPIFISLVFLLLRVSAQICHIQGACVYLLSYLHTCFWTGLYLQVDRCGLLSTAQMCDDLLGSVAREMLL
jgi:hypothetical protein